MSLGTYVVEDNKLVGPATFVGADGVEDTIVVDFWNQLLHEEQQECTRNGGQVEVVDHERTVQLESRAVAHEFSSSQNDDVV